MHAFGGAFFRQIHFISGLRFAVDPVNSLIITHYFNPPSLWYGEKNSRNKYGIDENGHRITSEETETDTAEDDALG